MAAFAGLIVQGVKLNAGFYRAAVRSGSPFSTTPDTVRGSGGAFNSNLQSNIEVLQNAGKNVLLSFGGGAGVPSSAYENYARNVDGLVEQLVRFATCNGFSGVDIDFSQVILPLQDAWGSEFGGVMGWEFARDQGGSWAEGIWHGLVGPVPSP